METIQTNKNLFIGILIVYILILTLNVYINSIRSEANFRLIDKVVQRINHDRNDSLEADEAAYKALNALSDYVLKKENK